MRRTTNISNEAYGKLIHLLDNKNDDKHTELDNLVNVIQRLKTYRSMGTCLITWYVGVGKTSHSTLLRKCETEYNETNNIKDSNIRRRAQDSILAAKRCISTLTSIPENGFALFAGTYGNNEIYG